LEQQKLHFENQLRFYNVSGSKTTEKSAPGIQTTIFGENKIAI